MIIRTHEAATALIHVNHRIQVLAAQQKFRVNQNSGTDHLRRTAKFNETNVIKRNANLFKLINHINRRHGQTGERSSHIFTKLTDTLVQYFFQLSRKQTLAFK